MKSALIAYVPVLHAGYRSLIERNMPLARICVLGASWSKVEDYLRKEIRSLAPLEVCSALKCWYPHIPVEVLEMEDIAGLLADTELTFVLLREDIGETIVERYLQARSVKWDSSFLRWHRSNLNSEEEISDLVSITDAYANNLIQLLRKHAAITSADWWRQVSAAMVINDQIVAVCCNEHMPHAFQPYFDGDPRNCLHRGSNIEVSTAIHAEAKLIANAARDGLSLKEASLYVTTFPCPWCSKLIAESGIKTCYFTEGYSVLHGADIMRSKGVQLVRVIMPGNP